MKSVVLAVLVGAATVVAQSRPQDVELQAAIRTATVSGDLKAAIQQFKAIVVKYPTDRVTVSKALLELAECYRRLGDAAAQGVYQQIVRDYSDQREAVALARARLAPLEAEPASDSGKLWTVPEDGEVAGPVSYDGRYVTYVDWSDAGRGDLFVHTIGTGASRRVTDTGNVAGTRWQRFPDTAALSRDGRQVAYSWVDLQAERYQVRIASLAGTASPAPRVLVDVERSSWIDPYDWTADGQWIAAMWQVKGGPREIGLISTKDGSLRPLKSIDRPCACDLTLAFSPDGRYLAFDLPGADTSARDIFAIALADGKETPAVVYRGHDALVGWTPDSQSIIFISDRTRPGTNDLWVVPFVGGKPGAQKLIRGELGPFAARGVSASGAVYYCRCEPQGGSDIKTAEFDFATGRFVSPPVDAVQEFVGTNTQPFWSNDGKSFVYRSMRRNQDPMLVVRTVATGESRELRPKLASFSDPRWSPDDRWILVMGRNFQNEFGWYRIAVDTGVATAIAIMAPGTSLGAVNPDYAWSRDGRKIYFRRRTGQESRFVDVDVATGQETLLVGPIPSANATSLSADFATAYYVSTNAASQDSSLMARLLASDAERELLRRPNLSGGLQASPDGRFLVVDSTSAGGAAMLLVRVAGGEAVELLRADGSQTLGPRTWANDSRSLIARKMLGPDTPELWWVPIDGRAPRKLDEFAGLNPAGIRVHPDGRRLLFGASQAGTPVSSPTELRVLEGVVKK